jgi:hypothetical protein
MENKASKTKTSKSASVPVVSGGNKIVEKKLNNQVVELAPQPTSQPTPVKKGGAKKVDAPATATATVTATAPAPAPALATATATATQKGAGKSTTNAKTTGSKKLKSNDTETNKTNVTVELEAEPEAQSKLRYFKLFYNNEICGRYCGKKPKQAANKAFSSIIKDMKKDGVTVTQDSQLEVPFAIKECTRNSKHKEYKYIGRRHLLKEPVKVSIDNGDGSVKEIVYKFHNQLQKAPRE